MLKRVFFTIPQFVQNVSSKNETVLEFLSPIVQKDYENQPLKISILLDNVKLPLDFVYHPDPIIIPLADKAITENSIINVNVNTSAMSTNMY